MEWYNLKYSSGANVKLLGFSDSRATSQIHFSDTFLLILDLVYEEYSGTKHKHRQVTESQQLIVGTQKAGQVG